MKKQIVIIGGGISGLATAYWFKKNNYDVVVLDKNKEPGGVMESVTNNGFMFDRGPNSGLEVTPLIKQIVDEIGMSDQFIYADSTGDKRYILRNNILHALPMKPNLFLATKLFSWKGKLRAMAEPFVKRSKDGYYQSLAEFVSRRLGKEFLDYAINPFVAGVYAGNPEELSVKSAFPKLYALEEKYGGIFVGAIKTARARKKSPETAKQSAKMFSFKNGMQSFPAGIAKYLGNLVNLNCDVSGVYKTETGYKVAYTQLDEEKSIDCDIVISAVPSYSASKLFGGIDRQLAEHLNEIYYPPVIVLYLVYKKSSIQRPLDGFGFLIPSKEKKSFLGAIWSSVIFPTRTTEDKTAFTLFIGGSRNPEIADMDRDSVLKKAIKEFQEVMVINEKPIFNAHRFWSKAIPQYNVGYVEHDKYFAEFETNNPGLYLSGNFRGGIAVGDCIRNSDVLYNKVKEFLDSKNKID
ncbi:MAG: protoporphyrinogen oxidase [Bacteroidota bacterium]|nr:protoporphyrinogen oxidase [Bacteroidota bacterium]